jgi:hypothetical protein
MSRVFGLVKEMTNSGVEDRASRLHCRRHILGCVRINGGNCRIEQQDDLTDQEVRIRWWSSRECRDATVTDTITVA